VAIYSSSAPAVKAIIVEQIAAALPSVQVTYNFPSTAPEREWVMVGDITWTKDDWGPFGQRARDEEYRIVLFVNVLRPGDSAQESAERAFELLAVVEDLLRAKPFPISARSISVAVEKQSIDGFVVDEGFESQIKAVVAVTARI
jgi:hypothetical protein